MEQIFLIEQIHLCPLENHPDAALWYEPTGWVKTEEEAQKIVDNGRSFTSSDCWAIKYLFSETGKAPEFKYRKLKSRT